ncbi:MAG: hypothetical protein ABI594_08315 [Ginsengibacter sp.]
MKKFLFAIIAGSISLLAITNGAVAQTSNKLKVFHSPGNAVVIYMLMSATDKTASLDGINTKALRNFRKAYKEATSVKWIKGDHGITAQFIANGIQTVVYYDTKGHWQGSLKNYYEEKFNSKLRGLVRSAYYDYKICYVQEIETIDTYGAPTYLAYIEDDANFKVIRIGTDVMDVYQQFKKQNNF